MNLNRDEMNIDMMKQVTKEITDMILALQDAILALEGRVLKIESKYKDDL
jgi:hypothetical protein